MKLFLVILFSFVSFSALCKNLEHVEGKVNTVIGQRFELILSDGTKRWFTTKTKLKSNFIGALVSGSAEKVGDTYRINNPKIFRENAIKGE